SFSFFSTRRTPPSSLFPYTTLFRSRVLLSLEQLLQRVQPPLDVGELHFLHVRGHLGVEQRADLLVDLARREVEHFHEAVALNFTDRKSTRLNSSHRTISYAVFCLKK